MMVKLTKSAKCVAVISIFFASGQSLFAQQATTAADIQSDATSVVSAEKKVNDEEIILDSAGIPLDEAELNALMDMLKPVDLDSETAQQIAKSMNVQWSPETIVTMRKLKSQIDIASRQSLKPIELRVNSEPITLSSIQKPLPIYTRNGYDTFVEFYDLAGNPWPVEPFISVGNSKQYEASRLPDVIKSQDNPQKEPPKVEVKSHIVRVTAKDTFGDSTMTIQLAGQNETANFRLITNELHDFVDYKRVFTVPSINREAAEKNNEEISASLSAGRNDEFLKAANESFDSFFSGDVPDGAILIPVLDGEAEAWMYKGFLYLKSRNENLSYPTRQYGRQMFTGGYNVHKMVPYPQITFYEDSMPKVILLDDEALMSAVQYQKIQMKQESEANEFLKVGG